MCIRGDELARILTLSSEEILPHESINGLGMDKHFNDFFKSDELMKANVEYKTARSLFPRFSSLI